MGVVQWSVTQSLRKAAVQVAGLIVSYLAAAHASDFGISVDQQKLTVGLFGLFQVARNYVKVKFKVSWL